MSGPAGPKKTLRRRLYRAMYDRGWTHSEADDTLRSRIAHAVGDMKRWYDWGHPVMWLVGRYDCGSAGAPRGRDLWWIPKDYVEGAPASFVADFEQRYGCYVTRRYEDVRATSGDIDWRIYDLQDEGRTVKVGLWPNRPEHDGRLQGLPWQEMNVRLFLWWFLWEHKAKAQWLGLRYWAYYKALHAAVNQKVPFACQAVPTKGGYNHWHCQLRKRHKGPHRFVNYTWTDGERTEYAPIASTRWRIPRRRGRGCLRLKSGDVWSPRNRERICCTSSYAYGQDAAYIAAMSPPVAKALAAWLRATADRVGGKTWTGSKHALAVARAVLGEEVPA